MTVNGDVSQDCTTRAIVADQLVLRRDIKSVQAENIRRYRLGITVISSRRACSGRFPLARSLPRRADLQSFVGESFMPSLQTHLARGAQLYDRIAGGMEFHRNHSAVIQLG